MRSSAGFRLAAQLAAAAILTALVPAGTARADRHCVPALEQYYGARHAILSPGLHGQTAHAACDAIAVEAIPRLGDAAAAARNCGCDALKERIEEMTDQARSTASCPSRIHDLLEAATELERLAENCH